MPASDNPPLVVYVGHGNPTGDIHIFDLDADRGALNLREVVSTGSPTSYFALHPTGRFAYTTQNRTDRVSAFAVDREIGPKVGRLRKLGDVAVPPTRGAKEAGPAYVTVDARGQFLLVANYRGHNAVVFQLGDDGGIGPMVESVSAGEHAHCVRLAPDNRFAFVCHLGADLVAQYRFDQISGALGPQDPPVVRTAPGAGPRHLTFAPDGRRAFLINELDATLMSFDYDPAHGLLRAHACVPTLPEDYQGRRWGSDVQVRPDGRFVYVSNRAHDSLAVFALGDDGDQDGGALRFVERVPCGGQTPRTFTLDPTGRLLLVANQDSGTVACFAIDPASGRLSPRGAVPVAASPYFVRAFALG